MLDAATPPAASARAAPGAVPSTFLERGVWVPFTTPQLAGARVRPAERGGLELICPNPTGARGVYILPLEGISALCTPTMHDRVLSKQLEALRGVTPSAIRGAALETARDGLAGREAAAAAAAARETEAHLVTLVNFELLMRLIRKAERRPGETAEDLERRAKQAVAALGAEVGRTQEQVAVQLEELARLYAPLGVGAAAGQGRVEREMAAIAALRHGIAAALQEPPVLVSADADIVLASADLTLACARKTVGDALGWLDNMPALLRRWISGPDEVADRLARPDWLLDGWDRICLLWAEGQGDRESRFAELAELVPATPREAAGWIGAPIEAVTGAVRLRRRVAMRQDWRTGICVMDLIARNEKLRAVALDGAR
jgi:hypothetical protein